MKVFCEPPKKDSILKEEGYQKLCTWVDDETPAEKKSKAKIL
jgi:hypothetical protein